MKICSIVGARPQFVKAAAVSRVLRRRHQEVLVHTGQHYDDNMSAVFFDELDIPKPDHNLSIGSGPHGAQTGAMLTGIERLLVDERPDWVLIYGDTNSTLAGALAAAKLGIPVAHVEAGLRSFNRAMPEEINRIISDQLSDLLLCPSQTAVDHLAAEGIRAGVHLVGDVMADVLAFALKRAEGKSDVLRRLGLVPRGYLLATVHRPENTDKESNLRSILAAFTRIDEPVIFPVHPRTRKKIAELGAPAADLSASRVRMIDPVGYLDMVTLEKAARVILTDSGGIQKEAYWLGVPCITLRRETEWVETVASGWNRMAGENLAGVPGLVTTTVLPTSRPCLYGDGKAAEQCVAILENHRPSSSPG